MQGFLQAHGALIAAACTARRRIAAGHDSTAVHVSWGWCQFQAPLEHRLLCHCWTLLNASGLRRDMHHVI